MERYQFTDAELMLLEQLPNPLAVYQFVGRQVYTLALSDGFREMSTGIRIPGIAQEHLYRSVKSI